MKKAILKTLSHAAAYYAVAVGAFSFVIWAMYSNEEGGALLSAKRIFLLLPFCLFLATANRCLLSKTLPRGLGYPLHCVATMAGIYLCILLPAGMESRQRLVGFGTAFAVYVAVMVAYALIARHVRRTLTEEKNYRSQFNDEEKK